MCYCLILHLSYLCHFRCELICSIYAVSYSNLTWTLLFVTYLCMLFWYACEKQECHSLHIGQHVAKVCASFC